MSQTNIQISNKPKAPHNAATLKFNRIQTGIFCGFLIAFVLLILTGIILRVSESGRYVSLFLLFVLSIYLIVWINKKQQQVRLQSGAVDIEWYDTNTAKLNETASRLASNLGLPGIQVEIGLKDSDFEVLGINCVINNKISVNARLVNEFTDNEIEFLLACSMFNYNRHKFNDPILLPFIYMLCIIVAIPFYLLFELKHQALYCFSSANILFVFTGLRSIRPCWQTSAAKYRKILAYTKNDEAAKSAFYKISGFRLDIRNMTE